MRHGQGIIRRRAPTPRPCTTAVVRPENANGGPPPPGGPPEARSIGALRLLGDGRFQRQREGVFADDARVPLALAARAVEADDALRWARRADAFAMGIVRDPRTQIALQRELCVRNVAEPEPPRWVRAVFGSHPTTLERIGIAEEALASAS